MSASGAERALRTLTGRSLHPGAGDGELLALGAPLSFWGGVDHSGTVVDHHHPQHGSSLTGRVVAMRSGRGSSSSAAVLAELIRSGRAPAALLLAEPDSIVVVGALVAAEMYDVSMPVVELTLEELSGLQGSDPVRVVAGDAAGPATVTLEAR